GQLPVTYLGLPLITKRLTKSNCSPLVESITARTNAWVNKSLSFAGRLQLVKATLVSMHTYWCNTFLLPIRTIKDCRILRNFLWGGNGQGKVKWVDVCKPQVEGGLGIRDARLWNKALLMKQIWNLLKAKGLLSWSWRQLLLLRPLVRQHLKYKCGNGERFSLWYDPWMHGDSVHALYGHRVIYDTGLGTAARVKDVLQGGVWCWPQVSSDLIEIQHRVQQIPISTASDAIFWGKDGDIFTTSKAWRDIRIRSSQVAWHCLVRHPYRIPKHAFVLWLALRGAHRTRDKLVAIGITQTASCVFNCGEVETASHLFFKCPYTARV
ncbi:LOW QUALITY PROTEIN: zf-RVT domain-containing protein, partial [Cephalotus follicularis]